MSKRPPLRVIEQYLTFSSVLHLLGGTTTMCDLITTLSRHWGYGRIQLSLLSRAGLPWNTARRRPAARRSPPRRPCWQARCLADGLPLAGLATALFGVLKCPHLQRPPAALCRSDWPRWFSRTPSVTQTASIHKAWKVHRDKHMNFLGGSKYAIAFSLCCCAGAE